LIRKLTSTALWILLALGALGGVGTIARISTPNPSETAVAHDDHAESALALHAAKVWLTLTKGETAEQRKKAVEEYWPDFDLQGWVPPSQNQTPREIYVQQVSHPASNFSVVSVEAWCEVSEGQALQTRHLVLNIPVLRTDSGALLITAPPTIVPPPALGQKPPSTAKNAPQDVYDVAKPFISDFMRIYLTSSNAADLANMVVPNTTIQPMGGFVQFRQVASLNIHDLGKGHYEAVVIVNVQDPATQTMLPEQFLVDFLKDDKGHLEVEKVWQH
jgi:hypothetical protein